VANLGRPREYDENMRVSLAGGPKDSKLQRRSMRRAVIDYIVDSQGSATLGEIENTFGFNTQPVVMSLVRRKWLRIDQEPGTVEVEQNEDTDND